MRRQGNDRRVVDDEGVRMNPDDFKTRAVDDVRHEITRLRRAVHLIDEAISLLASDADFRPSSPAERTSRQGLIENRDRLVGELERLGGEL